MHRTTALRALADFTAEQAGLVTSAQAQTIGVDRVTQQRLVETGLLERVGHGVYLLTGAEPPEHLDVRVAWLRLDPSTPAWERTGLGPKDGVVAYRSASVLHEVGSLFAPQVELIVPTRRTTRDPNVRLVRAKLERSDVTRVHGLPVTTVERTILDLLRDQTDGGHVGTVLLDADHRGMVSLKRLSERVEPLVRRYGLPKGAGRAFLSSLAAMADGQLEEDMLRQVAADAALLGMAAIAQFAEAEPGAPADGGRTQAALEAALRRLLPHLYEASPDPVATAAERLSALNVSPALPLPPFPADSTTCAAPARRHGRKRTKVSGHVHS